MQLTTDNPRAVIGDNAPPDAIDTALEPFGDVLEEVANWLDGATVENAGQLDATDALLKELKAARKAIDEARDECTGPLHEVWKAEVARWKPVQDDLDRQVKCLVAAQAPFKAALHAEQEAAKLKAREEAERIAEEARKAHLAANAASIEEQRKADELLAAAEEAAKAVAKADKASVKGMRTVQSYVIDDHRAALNSIARNDREAVTAFIEDYVRRNFKTRAIDGVTVTQTKEAF
jgi:uncharacterized protein with von Willebrand factor type A (vWA) domain